MNMGGEKYGLNESTTMFKYHTCRMTQKYETWWMSIENDISFQLNLNAYLNLIGYDLQKSS